MKKLLIVPFILLFTASVFPADTLERTAVIGKKGMSAGEFKNVADVETTSKNIYVLDSGNYRVSVYTPEGVLLMSFGVFGSGKGELYNPSRIAVDPSGCIYVLDNYSMDYDRNRPQASANSQNYYPRIQKFSADGKFMFVFGRAGVRQGEFLCTPSDMVTDKKGNLLVLDSCNSRIQVFDPSGKFIRAFGTYGSCKTCFDNPSRMDVDFDNNILVLDTGNSRFIKFDPDGNPLEMPVMIGFEDSQILTQNYFKILEDGTAAVLDSYTTRMGENYYGTRDKYFVYAKIKYFDREGRYIRSTDAMAQFQFIAPPYTYQLVLRNFISIAGNGDIFFLDTRNGILERYALKNVFIDLARITKRVYLQGTGRGNENMTDYDTSNPDYNKSKTLGGGASAGLYMNYPFDNRSYFTMDFSGNYMRDNYEYGTYGIPVPDIHGDQRETIGSRLNMRYSNTYDLNENKRFYTNLTLVFDRYNSWSSATPGTWTWTDFQHRLNIQGNAGIDITPFMSVGLGGSYQLDSYNNPGYIYNTPYWSADTNISFGF